MSSWGLYRIECVLCGHPNNCSLLRSTNTFGGVGDLDTRPGGAARADMVRNIQQCGGCGYCGPDLRQAPDAAGELVRSEGYWQALGDRSLPELARRWLCWSMIEEAAGEPAGAGWAALDAAWACDDARRADGADRMRTRAAGQFEAALRLGRAVSDEPGGEAAIRAGVLWRCGRFAEGIEACATGGRPGMSDRVAAGLAFQRLLCEHRDRRGYSFAGLERYARAPRAWRPVRWWEFWRG